MPVSIHAPARGATLFALLEYSPNTVSIHAPARGATAVHKKADFFVLFQSTLPHGERRDDVKLV